MIPSASTVLIHTVNLGVITHNVKAVRAIAGVSEFIAVAEADGHSQGALQTACIALDGGTTQFGVATIDKTLSVREELHTALDDGHAVPTLAWIWGATVTSLVQHAVAVNIDLGLPSMAHTLTVASAGRALSVTPCVTVMVDMDSGRLGFSMANGDFEHAVAQLIELHKTGVLNIIGAFTHSACTDKPGNEGIDRQAQSFCAVIAVLREAGLDELANHTANPPASLSRPDLALDAVCPGLAIHGGEPIVGFIHRLRPTMRWEASVILVKRLPAGQSVSYGQTWTAGRDTAIGIVPCGHTDGTMRPVSGRFEVSINDTRYPQTGCAYTDQFIVDLGPNTGVEVGDTTVIVGGPALGELGSDDLTKASGTINYKILTALKGRNERKWMHSRAVPTAEDIRDLSEEIDRELVARNLVALDGPFDVGKTILMQNVVCGMNMRGRVTSPAFIIAHEYRPLATDGVTFIHADVYRLFGEEGSGSDGETFDALGSFDSDTDLEDSVVVAERGTGFAEVPFGRYLQVSINCSYDDGVRVATWKWSKQLQAGSSRLLSMNTLAADISTPQVTARIVHDGETVVEKLHLDVHAHSEVLVPLTQQYLIDSGVTAVELDAVVTSCGSGSFTGLRAGMATAASFIDTLETPYYGVYSLDALVDGVGNELIVTGVRRREIYFAAYRDSRRVFDPVMTKPASIVELLKEEFAAEVVDFMPSHARSSLNHIE